MAPTYPDWSRMQKAQGVPTYAEEENFWPPYRNEVPIPFSPNEVRVLTRPSAHRVDESYMSKYSRAVQRMKELQPEDPRNFIQQANVHAAYCHACYFMDTTEKRFRVHAGWFFLPWHRWFLFFHERILRKLIGDDTFALPYWNWDLAEGMTIPPMYLSKERWPSLFNDNRNPDHGPASIVDLSFTTRKAPSSDKEEQIACNYRLMYRLIVGAKTARQFHGAPRRSSDSGCSCAAGTLELSPHNNVHNWMGIPEKEERQSDCPEKTCCGEDMGSFYSAARDPIFYAHHANVDRIWTIWQQLPGSKRKDYQDPDLLDTKFFFYDENARLVSVRAGDAFHNLMLGYQYEEKDITPWRKKPKAPPKPVAVAVEETLQIPLPLPPTVLLQFPIEFLHPVKLNLSWPAQVGSGEEMLLSIDGIRVQRNIAVKFDVFINLEDRLLITPYVDAVPKEFAATYVALPRCGRDDGCGQSSVLVGISEVLDDLKVKEGHDIQLTLVATGEAVIGHGGGLHDDRIRISSIQLIGENIADLPDDPIRISSIQLTGENNAGP